VIVLDIYFRIGGMRRYVGELSERSLPIDSHHSVLSLLTYLLSFLPHVSRVTEVIVSGDELVIKASGDSLKVLALGPSRSLFKLRRILALRRESRNLEISNLLFGVSEESFIANPHNFLKRMEKEVKSELRGEAKKELLRAVRELRKSMMLTYRRVLVDEESNEATYNHKPLRKRPVTRVIDEYVTDSFVIKICENEETDELHYNVEYPSKDYLIYLGSRFISHVLMNSADVGKECRMRLDELIEHRVTKSRIIIKRALREVPQGLLNYLSKVSTYRSLGLLKLMPFLLDDNICEFYVDAPETFLYLDHFKHGRCVSNVRIHMRDMTSFITHVKVESGFPLNLENPSLKADLSNRLFKVRVSIDIPPLAVDGPTIDVRKFRLSPFTLPELVEMNMLPLEVAAVILLYARHRANIVIVGEPGSGKTTLLNAIDMCLPNFFRRVYIEDVVESMPLHALGKHQVRLRVEPIEVLERSRTKKSEILKLLHRKPDYVILGELQSKEHFEAALSAMVSGLKCMQTCHAESIEQFLDRLTQDYGFSLNLVRRAYDLIVLLKRYVGVREFRRVIQVIEIPSSGDKLFIPIYSYPTRARVSDRIYSSSFFKKVSQIEERSMESLIKEYELYKGALDYMIQKRIFKLNEVASLFNKVVYRCVSKVTGEISCLALGRP